MIDIPQLETERLRLTALGDRHFEAYACALDALSVHPCRVKERAAREKQILIRRFKQEGFAV